MPDKADEAQPPCTLVAARFATPEALCDGIKALRAQGYQHLDAWLPMPDEAVEAALGLGSSHIARIAAASGCIGAILAYGVLWYTSVASYPIVVGGIAPHSPVAFLPITFETTILFSVLGAVGAFFYKTGLPRWYRPGFAITDIDAACVDGYFLLVQAPADITDCEAKLEALKPVCVQRVHA